MALTATDLFNDATTREIGGIGPDQINLIVSDLVGVQQQLSAADPQINNLSDLHTHVIINPLSEEIAILEKLNSPLDMGTTTANSGFNGLQQIFQTANNAGAGDGDDGA